MIELIIIFSFGPINFAMLILLNNPNPYPLFISFILIVYNGYEISSIY